MKGISLVFAVACSFIWHQVTSTTITDLKVSYISSCSLNVTWSSDCTTACKYNVSYTGPFDSSLSSSANKIVIGTLPTGDYSVCVVPIAANDQSVPPVCDKATVKGEAPGAVQKVKFTTTPSNITVSWTPAAKNNCTVDTIRYTLSIQNGTSKQSFEVSSDKTDYTFLKLEPCMEYTVTVDVISSLSNSTSGGLKVSTSIEAPSAPAFNVMDVSPTSLQVNWTASPAAACGVISNYTVKWVTADGKTANNITLGPDKKEYTIVNLTDASMYSVSVLAVATFNNTTIESESKALNVSTCGPVTSFINSKQNMCGMILSWMNTCKTSYNYTITWQGALNGSLDTDKMNYSFTNLPTGLYSFSVNSTYNPKEFQTLNVSIEEEAPGKVQDVKFASTSRMLTVGWTAAENLSCTAVPSGYVVILKDSVTNSTVQNTTVTTDQTFLKLDPCTDYTVSVVTLSAIANITAGDMVASTAAEVPGAPVVTEVEITPESLLVNWTASAAGNCKISNFTVIWKTVATNTTSNMTLGSDQNSYTINKLTESSEYDVSVLAVTTYQNKTFLTESAALAVSTCGPVLLLNKTEQNACGFTLSWQNNCTVNYNYTVSWKGQLVDSVNTSTTSQNFPDLPAGKYSFCVNSTYNSKDFKCLNTTIMPEAPGKVQNVTFEKQTRNLTVMWAPAANKSCTVLTKGYMITLLKASNHSVNMTMTVASNITNSTFVKLEPCTEYAISVDAVSSVANTSSGNMNQSTSIEAPSAPVVFVVGIDPYTFKVNWTVPNISACSISSYFLEWKMVNGKTLGNQTLTPDKKDAIFGNLTEESTITVSATAVTTYDKMTLNSTSSLNVSSCHPVDSPKNSKQSMCGINLSWGNTCTQSFNYTIMWQGALSGSLNTTDTNNSFPNLPSGEYNFCFNSSWNPEEFKYLNVSIKKEAPGKVENVTFAQSARMLTVAWTPAETYKCTMPTKSYMVHLQKNVNGSKIANTTVPEGSSFYTFKELDPCTEYIASVEVVSDLAKTTSGNLTSSTLIEAPAQPNITVSKHTSDSILVKWSKPMANACPIDKYEVTWRLKGANKGSGAEVSFKETEYTIKGLKHKTTYGINVTAHTSYHNTTAKTSSSELMGTTDGGSSTLGNIFLVNLFLIALLRICN